ncbi:MAG: hypothetical protein ACLFM0_04285 [Spirochaetales bacterium]
MFYVNELTDEQARRVLDDQELPEDLRNASRCTALVATQDWCPDWHAVNRWLSKYSKKGLPEDVDVTIYTVEYNKLPFFDAFRAMKERTWQNFFVPYIRYYVDGELVDESNRVGVDRFVTTFRNSGAS